MSVLPMLSRPPLGMVVAALDSGRAALPSVSGLNREKRPVAVTVSVKRGADEDAAWLPLDDYSRVVDYSRFPTQGPHAAGTHKRNGGLGIRAV